MTTTDFNRVIQEQLDYCARLLVTKGDEYSPDNSDRLHNFKVAAVLQGVSSKAALCGMLAKHVVSVYDMCRSGAYSLERWTEKITDSINYLLLLKALVKEEHDGQNTSENS